MSDLPDFEFSPKKRTGGSNKIDLMAKKKTNQNLNQQEKKLKKQQTHQNQNKYYDYAFYKQDAHP